MMQLQNQKGKKETEMMMSDNNLSETYSNVPQTAGRLFLLPYLNSCEHILQKTFSFFK